MILINHQHLYYFWVVAREGSVSKAREELHLSQPTISSQIIQLEKFLGKKLFDRRRRRLILTPDGLRVQEYAGRIFSQTQEMLDILRHRRPEYVKVHIGVDIHVAKQVAVRLLEELRKKAPLTRVVVQEGNFVSLLENLHRHSLDIVLSDQAQLAGQETNDIRVEVGHLDVFFVAVPALARQVSQYPAGLGKIPLVLPTLMNPLRGPLDHFLSRHKITPVSLIEIEDATLMRLAATRGLGAAPVHDAVAANALQSGKLVRLGRGPTGITKTLWLIARKSESQHPVIQHLLEKFRL